jgi:predicted RecB family endonuclease
MNEAEAIKILCAMLGGEPEVRHSYQIDGGSHYVRIDCETDTHAIEVGLDKRSSLDSVQQAEFAAWLAGKEPMVILINRDGRESSIEYRIRTTARRMGVAYQTISDDRLLSWQMTAYFRQRRAELLSETQGD